MFTFGNKLLPVIQMRTRMRNMLFNVVKCKVMHIGHRNSGFRYCMDGTELDTVDEEKDLEIIIIRDLSLIHI